MKRIFRYQFTSILPTSFTLSLGCTPPLPQARSYKRMSRSSDSPPSSPSETSSASSADRLIQRYDRQRKMSETCRRWRTASSAPGRCAGDVAFTLMSYNILAQDLLEMHEELYDKHDPVTLSWPHRYDRLMTEINLVRPDILCLQELQDNHKEQFSGGLANFNYDMIYKKRTGDKPDGCAIYYRRDLFDLIEYHDVEYYQPGVKRLDRENVAIIAKFGVRSQPDQSLVVATTHLLYNPRRQDIRLAQVQVLLAELDRLSYLGKYENGTPKYAPTIICGDFNLQPYTAPYVLLTTGFLQYENLVTNALEPDMYMCGSPFGKELLPIKLGIMDDCRHHSLLDREDTPANHTRLHHSRCDVAARPPTPDAALHQDKFNQGTLRHRFKFTSAYRHNIGEYNQEASTFQGEWISVDFLFYTKFAHTSERTFTESNLKLVSTYALPTVKQSRSIYTIPNMYFGSDHFALAGRFLLKPPADPTL